MRFTDNHFHCLPLYSSSMFKAIVIYWPSTESSIKRCTCVKKQKKTGKQVGIIKEYTQVPEAIKLVGDRNAWVRTSLQIEGCSPQWPKQATMWKKCCYGQEKNLGQYSSLSLSLLISHTLQKHWEQSVRDLFLLRSVFVRHWSSSLSLLILSLIIFSCIFLYCVNVYATLWN